MSEYPPETPEAEAPEQGGGTSTAYVPPTSGVVPGAETERGAATEGTIKPELAKLHRPELDSCPSCKIGLMYPIAWDEDAAHEAGQPLFAPRKQSGGSVTRTCFHCTYGDTVALNPTDAPPDPRTW